MKKQWWASVVYGCVLAAAGTSVIDHPVRFMVLALVLEALDFVREQVRS